MKLNNNRICLMISIIIHFEYGQTYMAIIGLSISFYLTSTPIISRNFWFGIIFRHFFVNFAKFRVWISFYELHFMN